MVIAESSSTGTMKESFGYSGVPLGQRGKRTRWRRWMDAGRGMVLTESTGAQHQQNVVGGLFKTTLAECCAIVVARTRTNATLSSQLARPLLVPFTPSNLLEPSTSPPSPYYPPPSTSPFHRPSCLEKRLLCFRQQQNSTRSITTISLLQKFSPDNNSRLTFDGHQ